MPQERSQSPAHWSKLATVNVLDNFKNADRRYLYAAGAVGTLGVAWWAWARRKKTDEAPRSEAPGLTRSLTRIATLHPSIQPMARALLAEAWGGGIALIVANGYRSIAEQQALYDQGRTTPGSVVTNAKPGSSWHNFALAFDVAVLDPSGTPTFPNDTALWDRIGQAGKKVGLRWGGDFTSFVDRPHFEHHPGITLAQAGAGARPAV